MRLSYGDALVLNSSRYFNPDVTYTEDIKPNLSVPVSGQMAPVRGKLEIPFEASDASGLSCALLLRNGNLEAEMPLTGQLARKTFQTPYYTPGLAEDYTILVYDTQGNKTEQKVSLIPLPGFDRAPLPFISISNSTVNLGTTIFLDATKSVDPDYPGGLKVEWDLNGDGIFDTAPSTNLIFTTHVDRLGTQMIYARLTDLEGYQSISEPLALRTVPEPMTALILIVGGIPVFRNRKLTTA
jgi:hypothetical protein